MSDQVGYERVEAPFAAEGGTCAAWMYLPQGDRDGLTCVVMAHGFSLTRHDGLAPFAEAFAGAGAAVLVFDFRHLGDSPTATPGRLRVREQLADWAAAVASARAHPRVDPSHIVAWGFSLGGGHAATTAARDGSLASSVLLCPMLDGLARTLATRPPLAAWILVRSFAELLGRPVRIRATAPPGEHGAMTLSGEADGFDRAVDASGPWRNSVGPALFATIFAYRPVRRARQLRSPVWLGLGGRDITVSGRAIRRMAERAPHAELQEYADADHFDVLLGETAQRVAVDQVAFLVRVGLLGYSGLA